MNDEAKITYLYMCVTNDKYELPIAVADSVAELSRMLSIPRNRISSAISHAEKKRKRSIYVKVKIEQDD